MGNSPSKNNGFPGSALLDSAGALCSNDTTDNRQDMTLLEKVDATCISSPKRAPQEETTTTSPEPTMNPTSALFARALVSEVTDNPKTMTPAAMAEREKKLLKAQEAARKPGAKPVGTMGQPHVLGSLVHALGKHDDENAAPTTTTERVVRPPDSIREGRAQQATPPRPAPGKHSVTIGLSLSRRHSTLGHPDTVTRQTAFDFNELQDREYKYVSSTDSSGWMAGGGERGGVASAAAGTSSSAPGGVTSMLTPQGHHKVAAPDTVHIPIIQIDAESPAAINVIVSALARGEVFIPHMTVLPEALSVNGISPPDLVVRFGCERNDDVPPDEWPNWCLEFMHNQLYEYFYNMGARWSPRPFQITLARQVRWKTVKHMNRYFAHAERVIDAWREQGPQYLDPQLTYIEGGATPEEVARPHGIYLLRNGVPTNYFAPNFDPPYTTKMTRSLLLNVLSKSWDKKRREWTSEPVPRLVTPATLVATMCGCTDAAQGGFMATEVTNGSSGSTSSESHKKKVAPPVATAVEKAISDDDEEEDIQIHNSTSGTSTKMSSVLLTPYNAQDAAVLGSKLDDTYGGMDVEDSMEEEEESTGNEDWDPNLRSPENKKERGRSGRAPTPEQGLFRARNPDTPPAESDFASSTTVPHLNTSGAHESPARKKNLTVLDTAAASADNEEEVVTPKSTPSSSGKKKKKSKQKIKEAYEKERARQIAMIALAQEETNKMQIQNSNSPRKELGLSSGNTPRYSMQNTTTKPKNGIPDVQRNDSGGSLSLDYSLDSSGLGDSSTLAGNQFIGDGSVSTNTSKRKKWATEDESVNDSEVSAGVVPTDEELFAVGWAKALDPKTGSYYYFTLDRTKIVWDNPLDDELTEASAGIPPQKAALTP